MTLPFHFASSSSSSAWPPDGRGRDKTQENDGTNKNKITTSISKHPESIPATNKKDKGMSGINDQRRASNKDASSQVSEVTESKTDAAASSEPTATENVVDPPRFSTTHPTRNDVLFGRGRPLQSHSGNIRFHSILNRYRQQYQQSHERHERSDIVVRILLEVAAPQRVAIPAIKGRGPATTASAGGVLKKTNMKSRNSSAGPVSFKGRGRTLGTSGDKGPDSSSVDEERFVVLPGGKFLKRRSQRSKKDTEKKKPPPAAVTGAAVKNQTDDKDDKGSASSVAGDSDDDEGSTTDGACSSTVMTASTSAVSAPTAAAASILSSLAVTTKPASASSSAAVQLGRKAPPMNDPDDEASDRTQSSVPQVLDREDICVRMTSISDGRGRSSGCPKDVAPPPPVSTNTDASIRNKYVLANSNFGGVVWEEVPMNEAMEKIRHALRGEETIKSTVTSDIHAPTSFSSESRRYGGKRSATKLLGNGGRPSMNAPSNKRPFFRTTGNATASGRPSVSSNILDLSSNTHLPPHVSFATPGNTAQTALQSLLQNHSPAGARAGITTTTSRDFVAPSRSIQFSDHPRTSLTPSSVPPSTEATRNRTSISNSIRSVLLEQQRHRQQQQQQQSQSNLLEDLLSGQSPSNSNDLQQMLFQSLLGQQQNQTLHHSSSHTNVGSNPNTMSATMDRNQSILETNLGQQQMPQQQLQGSQPAFVGNPSSGDDSQRIATLIQGQLSGLREHPQQVTSNQSGTSRKQDALVVDEDLIRSHLQKMQDLEKLRDIVDGELERARKDAMLTVLNLLAAVTTGESRHPAALPSNPSGSSGADAGVVARFLDPLGRKK